MNIAANTHRIDAGPLAAENLSLRQKLADILTLADQLSAFAVDMAAAYKALQEENDLKHATHLRLIQSLQACIARRV